VAKSINIFGEVFDKFYTDTKNSDKEHTVTQKGKDQQNLKKRKMDRKITGLNAVQSN